MVVGGGGGATIIAPLYESETDVSRHLLMFQHQTGFMLLNGAINGALAASRVSRYVCTRWQNIDPFADSADFPLSLCQQTTAIDYESNDEVDERDHTHL